MAVNENAMIFAIYHKQLTIYSNGNMIVTAEKSKNSCDERKSAGVRMDLRYTIFETEFGYCGLLGSGNGVFRASLPLPDCCKAEIYLLVGITSITRDNEFMPKLQEEIRSYFLGKFVDFSRYQHSFFDLAAENDGHSWKSTSFGRNILHACCKIPYGETVSYGQLAKSAGHPKAARAVGNIMGKNPLPIIIPCHRVIKADGACGGFMRNSPGATQLKAAMLNLESNELLERLRRAD